MNPKVKKYTITFSIVVLCFLTGYRMLHSPNFLLFGKPKDYRYFFYGDNNKYKIPYYFGNLKNSISIYEINDKYRCYIWQFNEYSLVPEYDSKCLADTILIEKYLDNYFGTSPIVGRYNKMGLYPKSKSPTVRVNCSSDIFSMKSDKNYLNVYGSISEIGIFNDDNNCELKFKFDEITNARAIFYKSDTDFFILVAYGIYGNVLNEDFELFNDFGKL